MLNIIFYAVIYIKIEYIPMFYFLFFKAHIFKQTFLYIFNSTCKIIYTFKVYYRHREKKEVQNLFYFCIPLRAKCLSQLNPLIFYVSLRFRNGLNRAETNRSLDHEQAMNQNVIFIYLCKKIRIIRCYCKNVNLISLVFNITNPYIQQG